MNILQRAARQIIKKSFYLSVWTIEQVHDMESYKTKAENLGRLPNGTLGNDIYNCLKINNLNLVPGYESHDLKHVLLQFKMTPEDEIRMQAFMLGNGNITFPSIAILLFGSIFLPDKWGLLIRDFQHGKRVRPISKWTIENYAHKQTSELRAYIADYQPNTTDHTVILSKISRYGAFLSMAAGGFGMLFCFPFLWSSQIEDLIGAGFPFVGGAILFSAGLIALSILSQKTRSNMRIE